MVPHVAPHVPCTVHRLRCPRCPNRRGPVSQAAGHEGAFLKEDGCVFKVCFGGPGVMGPRAGGGGQSVAEQPSGSWGPDFIVGKNEILQNEDIDLAVFGTQTFGLLGSRTPPHPPSPIENSGGGGGAAVAHPLNVRPCLVCDSTCSSSGLARLCRC